MASRHIQQTAVICLLLYESPFLRKRSGYCRKLLLVILQQFSAQREPLQNPRFPVAGNPAPAEARSLASPFGERKIPKVIDVYIADKYLSS